MTGEKLPEIIHEKDVQIIQPSPIEMAQAFLKAGGDPANIERMMDLQEKWERREAEKAFYKAMTEFKKNPPKIFKDRHVEYNNTKYNHASLSNIVEVICSELSKHGLTADWHQSQENNQLTVTCYLTHELGFSKKTSMTAPPDISGGKNGIQGLGSTNSYLQRYTLLAITGLATHEQDNDGASFPVEVLTTDQAIDINDRLKETNSDVKKFCGIFQVNTVEDIPASCYGKALAMLKAKAAKL